MNNENIKVEYKPTKLNIADLFTKPVSPQVMDALLPYLTGVDMSWKDDVEVNATQHVVSAAYVKSKEDWIDIIILPEGFANQHHT